MYSQHTDHHKIYQHNNWGITKGKPSETIIKNRNKFITEYDIKKVCKTKPKYVTDETKTASDTYFDHNEYYVDKNDDFVIVSNPYDDHDNFFFSKGWTKYKPIYHDDCVTYVKRVGKGRKGK